MDIDYVRPILTDLNKIDPSQLVRSSLGAKGFHNEKEQFEEIHRIMVEMAKSLRVNETLANNTYIISEFQKHINELKTHYVSFLKYSLDSPENMRTQTVNIFNQWVRQIYQGYDGTSSNQRINNFLCLMSILISWKEIQEVKEKNKSIDQEEINAVIGKIRQNESETTRIVESLKNKAAEESVRDYSAIFKTQAEKYSKASIKSIWFWKWKLGFAQRWLTFAVICSGILILLSLKANEFLTWDDTASKAFNLIQVSSRFVVFSFLVYVVTFLFKQYSINQHLHTLNQHRQNTLESYELFISSLGDNNSSLREALMMEVAKAIYEAGNTGYISKTAESTPSIIEMTRLINSKSNPSQ